MILLGLILLVLAALAVVAVLTGNHWDIGTGGHDLSIFGISLAHVSVSSLFVAGLVTGLIALLGLWLVVLGSRRSVRHRREARVERKAVKEQEKQSQPSSTSTSVPTTGGAGAGSGDSSGTGPGNSSSGRSSSGNGGTGSTGR